MGLPFSLTKNDIVIPTHCPVLGIPLKHGVGRNGMHLGSPTIDRLTPDLGYVPGNILVVSYLANSIKSEATPAQIRAVADFYDSHLRKQETL
jgi:hypothetical protein